MSSWFGTGSRTPPPVDHEAELERNRLLAEITMLRAELNEMHDTVETTKDPRFTRVPVKLSMPMRQAILAYTGKCLRDKLRINADTLYRELIEAWASSQKDDVSHSKV